MKFNPHLSESKKLKAGPSQVKNTIYCIRKLGCQWLHRGARETMGLWALLRPIHSSLSISYVYSLQGRSPLVAVLVDNHRAHLVRMLFSNRACALGKHAIAYQNYCSEGHLCSEFISLFWTRTSSFWTRTSFDTNVTSII